MAKNYYLSEVIQADYGEGPVWTTRAADILRSRRIARGVDYAISQVIPTGPDGNPTSTWAFCIVDSPEHAELRADTAVDELPAFPFDAQLTAMAAFVRTKLRGFLTRRGIAHGDLDDTVSYRRVLERIGDTLQSGFNLNNFDCYLGA